jgi:LmbE family N-acetylglucosaminyl deacetylase
VSDTNCERVTRREALAASVKTAGLLAAANAAITHAAAAGPDTARPERWLIVGAHPDDEAKAVALILKERRPGDALTVLVMRLCGEGAAFDRKSWTREEAIAVRSNEMEQAAALLEAELRWWLPPHPENKIIVRTPETVAKMVGLLEEIRPTRIVANWREDSHPDHVGTGEVVGEAVKQWRRPGGTAVYWFGTPGPGRGQKHFVPNHYVDISDPSDLAAVLWARCVHRSQSNLFVMQSHLKYYWEHGRKAGVEYAAGYMLERI